MESNQTLNQTRSKRWNRRSSDGAAWESFNDDLLIIDNDECNYGDGTRRRRRWSSCPWTCGHVASDPVFGREPIVITEEFRDRIKASSLAAVVTFVTFSLLVFSGQEFLPVAWIGNVIAISTLKPTLGDTILSAKDIFIPMVPVATCSWGISFLLGLLSTKAYSILLPFVVMAGCFVIILCPYPYLTMKNLMLVMFYLIVASPLSLRQSGFENSIIVQEDLGPWFVPGLMGTCTTGLFVALLVHVMMIPTPKSTTASHLAQRLVDQLAFETHELLLSVSNYTSNIGKQSGVARQSRTLIEFYVKSRKRVLRKLERCLPAMRAERYMTRLLPNPLKYDLDTVIAYVACAQKQSAHAELIRLATTQQFLGEDFTMTNETVRDVKKKISTNLGYAVEQLAKEYVRSEHALFFAGSSSNSRNGDTEVDNLGSRMEDYRKAMKQAITDAESLLLNDEDASRSTTGPLIRQRVAFLGVYSFVRELHDMATNVQTDDKPSVPTISRLTSTLKMPWLWGNIGKRRLALKTMIGLGLSSLWVSIPYLRGHIAYPNSIWIGVTVASVSLETSGATWVKCLDRLWGTLVAGGYAMLIGKVLDNSNSIAKLIALTAFTFAATFLTNHDRPYASRYAATSVGSILYGSLHNGVAVNEYVPQRVMLIFVGVVTFLFVEMVLLPRSSRTIVQAQSIQFFEDLEHVLFDASKVFRSISSIHSNGSNKEESNGELAEDDPVWMLRKGHEKITLAKDLTKAVETVSKTVKLAKSELKPGFAEPSLGLNIGLSVEYENLLMEQSNILSQLDLLITTVKSLIGYYAHLTEDHPVRSLHWPALLSANLVLMAQKLSECADRLRHVFPHGLCRPGACEVSQVIRGVAIFQNFEDLILTILSDVADRHASYLNLINSSGVEVRYTPGFRLTLALAVSAILTIGKSLNSCGKHLEKIVQSFPIEEVTSMTIERRNTSVSSGDDNAENGNR